MSNVIITGAFRSGLSFLTYALQKALPYEVLDEPMEFKPRLNYEPDHMKLIKYFGKNNFILKEQSLTEFIPRILKETDCKIIYVKRNFDDWVISYKQMHIGQGREEPYLFEARDDYLEFNRHWKAIDSDNILCITYEDMVTCPEYMSQTILEFLEIDSKINILSKAHTNAMNKNGNR
jgi:hypothetical protein